MPRPVVLEPVAAYDRIATEFSRLSDARRAYLNGIEKLVLAQIQPGMSSLLDVGAGDGSRSLRISRAAGLTDITLLEPSAGMRALWPAGVQGWSIRAEQLDTRNGQFDVITCLWNVLGHIFPSAARVEVLRQCARLLAPAGVLLVDVNHRYNGSHYGWPVTLFRILHDRIRPSDRNGDITARWNINRAPCATPGHVFTDPEFRHIANDAGLTVANLFAVDYRTGQVRASRFSGSLFYVLKRRT